MDANIFDDLELAVQSVLDDKKAILIHGQVRLVREEIYHKAMQIGSYLAGVHGLFNQPIAVLADHSADTILCFLGILASGNYYIPLSPNIKKERFEKIRRMAGFDLVMGSVPHPPEWMSVQGERDKQFPEREVQEDITQTHVSYLYSKEVQSFELQEQDIRKLELARRKLPKDAPMYLIFTSGSTGEPKGIIKTHQGLIHFLEAYIEEFGFMESDRIAGQTPFYFDASAKDIYLALKQKCEFHILDESDFVRPLQLAQYLRDAHITVIQWVPSALGMLSRFRVFDQVELFELRMVMSVGEALPVRQLQLWMNGVPGAEYVNLYGASEVSGICTFYRVRHLEEGQETVPVGYPLKCCSIYLIADGHVVTQPGQAGEMYVAGSSLAAGYLDQNRINVSVSAGHETDAAAYNKPAWPQGGAFVYRPYPELPDGIYFKSGDLAEYGKQGELLFLSRKDDQVKHMGHRIELGEIEAEARKISQVQNCCCIYESKKQKIVLFYEGDCKKADVSGFLKKELAAYMLPNKLIQIEQGKWPLNANGKTDRVKLKEQCMTHPRMKQAGTKPDQQGRDERKPAQAGTK